MLKLLTTATSERERKRERERFVVYCSPGAESMRTASWREIVIITDRRVVGPPHGVV